jgi:dTMP kinase
MTRSALVGEGLKAAKVGHTLGWLTMTLFYATDFADRLENEMIPALRAGFIVLTIVTSFPKWRAPFCVVRIANG